LSRPRHAPKRIFKWTALISGVVVIALAFGAGWFFFLRDTGPTGNIFRPAPEHQAVPRFDFHMRDVRPIPTGKTGENGGVYVAKKAAANIRSTLNRLYRTAYVDPNAWKTGRYGDIWSLFDHATLPKARSDLGTLTLGENAGSTYESVTPTLGKLSVRVLLDHAGNPSTAVAIVSFRATGDQMHGGIAAIHSKGQYFLRPAENAWSIYGYDLMRQDEPVAATAAGTPSP
jgi:hypothetical protein